MSRPKEPHVFTHDRKFADVASEYETLFRHCEEVDWRGESSTSYAVYPRAASRIKDILVDPHFVFLLRNPVNRLYSHYWWMRNQGLEWRPLRWAVRAEMGREFDPGRHFAGNYRNYLLFSRYGKTLERYFSLFGRDAIRLTTTASLKADPLSVVNKIADFLDCEPLEEVDEVVTNKTRPSEVSRLRAFLRSSAYRNRLVGKLRSLYHNVESALPGPTDADSKQGPPSPDREKPYPPISHDDRSWLEGLLEDDLNHLELLTGRDFSEWRCVN